MTAADITARTQAHERARILAAAGAFLAAHHQERIGNGEYARLRGPYHARPHVDGRRACDLLAATGAL